MGHRDVEEDGAWPMFLGAEKGFLAVASREYGVAEILEKLLNRSEESGFIIDEKKVEWLQLP